MINNSPPSAPAASSARSNAPTAHCTSPNSTASQTQPKRPRLSPSAKATRKLSTFYLHDGRVHVGDLAKATDDAFDAWITDRKAGLDAIMLAPTRDLVADLNRRARDNRLRHAHPGREIQLADGNQASIGDTIITRTNDRRLRLSATNWVKNGDRWTITNINDRGDLTVRHSTSRLTCRLPADLRRRINRARLRQHHPRRPRHLRRHHARHPHRTGIPPAAVHDAHPRPTCEPRLPPGRRRR